MNRGGTAGMQRAVHALSNTGTGEIARLTIIDCALMLAALPNLPALNSVRTRLFARLNKTAHPAWLRTGEPHTVFLTLFALQCYKPASMQGKQLAIAVQRLVQAEVAVGGPYTFIGNRPTIGANAVVAAFARRVAEPLPKVEAFLQNASHTDPFFTPAGVRCMLNFAGILQPNVPKKPTVFLHNHVSPAIVAMAVELGQAVGIASPQHKTAAPLQQHIINQTGNLFTAYDEPLYSAAHTLLHRIKKADTTYEISLLPYFFAQALGHTALTDTIQTLCIANVCGWMAYTLYDHLLDSEAKPNQLPLANIAMRESVAHFRQALPPHLAPAVAHAFTTMDHANAWELTHCRFKVKDGTIIIGSLPQYGQGKMLAARSFAHVLAPLVLLKQADARKATQATTALQHYLIARQLNDDLHDWQQDVRAGQATYVVTALLRGLKIKSGTHAFSALLPALQEQFYTTTMAHISRQAINHIQQARQLLNKSYRLTPNNQVYAVFEHIRCVAEQTLAAPTHGDDFLQHFT